MSNDIREGTTIVLADGDEVRKYEIFPASLRQLRKLNSIMGAMNLTSENLDDDTIDKMIEAAAVILSKVDKDLSENPELIEDLVDVLTFNQMFNAAMGADPNE